MGGSVIEITSESEFNIYINSPTLTIVDFTATWCGPCKMVAPRYEALASKYPSVPFLKVDVDQHRDISGTWGVRAMPTFMFFQAGQKVDEVVGADIGKVESLVYMKAPKGGSFPATGGRTLGGGSGSGEAGGSYVNPWKDEKPVVGGGGVVKPDVVGKKETGVTVSQSDKKVLIEMGFAESRVVAALKATGNAGLQPAMDWLFANPDESFMDVEESSGTAAAEGSAGVASNDTGAAEGNDDAITEAEATAASLKCDDCGRLLRDAAAAEFHAVKSGHQNFSESTQVIKPLTEEEKKAKLEQLKIKMAQKKEEKRLAEIEESKAKEKVRRTTGKEMVEMKEKMAELELKKAAEQKKREKEEDRIAKAKIKAQIELDRKDRAARIEKEKLERQGIQSSSPLVSAAASTASVASAAGPKEYTEARIQFRLANGGVVTHTFASSDLLSSVYAFVAEQTGVSAGSFKLATTFPRIVLTDQSKSLKELGLAPSAALAVV